MPRSIKLSQKRNLREICEKYKVLLYESDEIEKVAEERLQCCIECGNIEYVEKKSGEISPHCAEGCFCWIPALIRLPEKHCEKGKF